ncbi:MAG TPA: phosphate ABC transporter substrate-binding protein PstS [Janthinobacterium sp.]|nr:phosphate ABC transporter substrate-binding protein PstS [Janthinobacterium sp.]
MFAQTKALLTALLVFTAGSAAAVNISGAGSSAAAPLYGKLSDYYVRNKDMKIDYQPVGSSAGIEQIKSGAVDFGASDVSLSAQDAKKFKLICFPSVISGVVPVLNVPGIKSEQLRLNGALLADIFSRKLTMWNDPALLALNPGVKLPALAITVLVRLDGSGTTYNFTDYLSKVSPAWKQSYGKNFTIAWPAAATQIKGSAAVAAAVKLKPGAISYVDFNYVVQDKLTFPKMLNQDGKFVAPGAQSFGAALANSSWASAATYEEALTDKPGADSWPITMGTFVIVPQVTGKPERTIATLKFFTWAFMNGDAIVGDLNFVRLPDRVQARIYGALVKISDTAGAPLRWSLAEVLNDKH